jgi:sugar O-acyltransferase (sialic acid O-acetyltransferase NeuD family)
VSENNKLNPLILVGYSGHSYGVIEAWKAQGGKIKGYVDEIKKEINPFNLVYLGSDKVIFSQPKDVSVHLSLGDLIIRRSLIESFQSFDIDLATIISPESNVSSLSIIGNGTFVARGVNINAYASIGQNCIINTSCSIDHEVIIGDNTHIAPGAVIAGGVRIGSNSFIGANSVIKQNTIVENNAIIGAGSVVLRNVKQNQVVAGNPSRIIKNEY